MKFRSLTILAGMLATVAVAGAANAAEKLKFAHVYEVSEPYHAQALWAADEIKKRTDGRYEVDVFPASSLGKETDINQALSLGTVDIIYTGNLFAGNSYGPLSIAGAPFMFRDLDHWKSYTKSDLFKELADGYKGVTGRVTAHSCMNSSSFMNSEGVFFAPLSSFGTSCLSFAMSRSRARL